MPLLARMAPAKPPSWKSFTDSTRRMPAKSNCLVRKRHNQSEGRHRQWHWHGAPALHAYSTHDGYREYYTRPRTGQSERHPATCPGRRKNPYALGRIRSGDRPQAKVEDLSVGLQQRVEILKALYRDAKILILDEPTAVLTPLEVKEFFQILRRLKSQGKTIVIITHKLEEVLEISDDVTVMRNGKRSESCRPKMRRLIFWRT